jgi:hypothetical protein
MLFDVLRAGSAGAEVFFCARGGGLKKRKKCEYCTKQDQEKKDQASKSK